MFLLFISHRSYQKVERLLGKKIEWYYTFNKGGNFGKVTEEDYLKIKSSKIKGVTKARNQNDDYAKCWKTMTGIPLDNNEQLTTITKEPNESQDC